MIGLAQGLIAAAKLRTASTIASFYPGQNSDDVGTMNTAIFDHASRAVGNIHIDVGDDRTAHNGFRFRNVTVPKDAIIVSAKLTLSSASDSSTETVNLIVKGHKSATPDTFSTHADFNGRTRTDASALWSDVGPWSANDWYDSPEIKTIISEITSLSAWVSGNNLVIFVENNGSSTGLNVNRITRHYNSGYSYPTLTIEYR